MGTEKHPFVIPPVVARHLQNALREEIERQDKIAETLGENGEWPDDYDPNDVAGYRRWCEWLEEAKVSGGRLDNPTSKPLEFMMQWLPFYARKNCHVLPPRELEELFRTYADYVAAYCASALPDELARPTSRAEFMRRMLLNLLNFPRAAS